MTRQFPPRDPSQRQGVQARQAFGGSISGRSRNAGPVEQKATRSVVRVPTSTTVTAEALWIEDHFTVSSTSPGTFALTYIPRENSEDVKVNGVGVLRTTEWTRSGSTLTIDSGVWLGLTGSWDLTVQYQISSLAPTVAAPTYSLDAMSTWAVNDAANLFSLPGYIALNGGFGAKGSAIPPTPVPAGWSSIDLSVVIDLPTVSADGFAIALLDSAHFATSYIGDNAGNVGYYVAGAVPAYSSAVAFKTYSGGSPGRYFASNDGTTSANPSAAYTVTSGPHTYRIVWTVTGTNRCSTALYVDASLIATATNQYAPDSPYLFFSAGNGALYNDYYIRATPTVTVT